MGGRRGVKNEQAVVLHLVCTPATVLVRPARKDVVVRRVDEDAPLAHARIKGHLVLPLALDGICCAIMIVVGRGARVAPVWAIRLKHAKARVVDETLHLCEQTAVPSRREAGAACRRAGCGINRIKSCARARQRDQIVPADLDAMRVGVGDRGLDLRPVQGIPRLQIEPRTEREDDHVEPAARGHNLVNSAAHALGRHVGQVHEERRLACLRREEPRELSDAQTVPFGLYRIAEECHHSEALKRIVALRHVGAWGADASGRPAVPSGRRVVSRRQHRLPRAVVARVVGIEGRVDTPRRGGAVPLSDARPEQTIPSDHRIGRTVFKQPGGVHTRTHAHTHTRTHAHNK
jgi:hypothetical protein